MFTLWTQADAFATCSCRLRDQKRKSAPAARGRSSCSRGVVLELLGELVLELLGEVVLELLGGVDTLRPRRIGPQWGAV
jgi:hypothetical protein